LVSTRAHLVAVLLISVAVIGTLALKWSLRADATSNPGAPFGPAIDIGPPSLVGGNVTFQIVTNAGGAPYDAEGGNGSVACPNSTVGTNTDPTLGVCAYGGFSVHVRWDPLEFHFGSASTAGALFGGGNSSCTAPNTSVFDSDGGG